LERPGTIVQEDGASPHKNRYGTEVYSLFCIEKMDWPPNSPDINAIEPCWMWMKRKTTEKGPIRGKKNLTKAWSECWAAMPQDRIQAWIERIPGHIQEILNLGGGNQYKEGRLKGQEKRRVH
jgi:hypothetical protein